jgi:hypothetical protein
MIRKHLLVTAVLLLGAACELDDGSVDKGDRDQNDITGSDAGSRDTDDHSPGNGHPLDASAGGDHDEPSADAGTDDGNSDPDDSNTDTDVDAAAGQDSGSGEQSADAGSDPGPSPDAGDDPTGDPELPALAAHFTFDETSGTTASDSAGAFADAVLNGEASFATGVSGNALDLPGGASQSYVSLPANILDGCNDITIALWMKLGSVTFWSRLLDLDGGLDGFLYFTPAQDVGSTPHLYFDIYHPGEGAADQGVSAAYPQGTTLVDQWHHVAFTLSAGVGHLYFDGAEIGSAAMATKPSDLSIGENAHAWIGRSMFPDPYLDATIDDLRISCTAYTADQVADLAQ